MRIANFLKHRSGKVAAAVIVAVGVTMLSTVAAASSDEVYDVAPFTKLTVGGNYSLQVRVGAEQMVVLTGEPRDLDRMKVEVRNDTLFIGTRRNTDPGRVDVVVGVETLSSLEIAGAVDARISGIDHDDFDFSLAGSVRADAAGTCGNATVQMAGSIRLDAGELACDRVQVEIAGSGRAAVHATEEVTVSIAGSGHLDVYGNPARVIPGNISGSSSFNLK